MRSQQTPISEQEHDQEFFDVAEDEIMYHWRAIRSKGLSDKDVWQAIVTGIALDMAFGRNNPRQQREH